MASELIIFCIAMALTIRLYVYHMFEFNHTFVCYPMNFNLICCFPFKLCWKVKVLEHKRPLPFTIPEHKISYSDHEAVTARLLIQSRSKSVESISSCFSKNFTKHAEPHGKCYADTLGEGIEVLDAILKRLRSDKNAYFVSLLNIHLNLF